MTSPDRVEAIRSRLVAQLSPTICEVIDESHLHAGHAGARDGRGHFRVRISSPRFQGLSRIACHRLVYEALADLLRSDIHALSIDTLFN